MKTVLIKEYDYNSEFNDFVLDLSKLNVKDCCGCWTCWWKTPGKCIFKELDTFYREYVSADKAIFFAKVSKGFVSGDMKTLFDRMIPLFMPYTSVSTGESMHVIRYDKYPDIEFYYEWEFATEEVKRVYEEYVNRVFYQFFSKNIVVKHISEYMISEGV